MKHNGPLILAHPVETSF